MITDKENEFVLIDKNNSKFSVKLKDGVWSFDIDDGLYDEFSCGISRFEFKGNNQAITDLIVKLFNEIGKSSDVSYEYRKIK